MAAQEGVHPAHEVSDAFLEQYFRILKNMPHEAHRLYVDASVVTRPAPDGTMTSFSSVEAINDQFIACDYKSTTFEVLSVDSQNSLEDGIFIMVIGFLTGKDKLRRKFSQMFYLARPKDVYVVLNDIFRYVDESVSCPITPPVPEPVPETDVAEPAEDLDKTEAVKKNDASVKNSASATEVKNVSEVQDDVKVTPPLVNGKIEHSDEKVDSALKPAEPVVETVAPQPDGTKRSFAAIVQSMAKNAAPFQAKAPVQKPKYMGQARAAVAPQAPDSAISSEKKKEQKIVEEPGTSIFVANLPMNAMPPQLHELFKEFGPIKENGVQVRSSRGSGICFGFVAFESATSVQSVLEAAKNNPFVLADRKLRVKEKQVDYEGNKRTSGGSSRAQNGSTEGSEDLKRRENSNKNRRNGGRMERRRGEPKTKVEGISQGQELKQEQA